MSERQAKLKRKNEEATKPVKKKSKADVIVNAVIVVLVLTVAGLGAWAVASKYAQNAELASLQEQTEEQTPITVAEQAEEMGIGSGEFMTEFGLDQIEEITPETSMDDAVLHMTLENYAKLIGETVEAIKEVYGLGEEFTNETLMSEVIEFTEQLAQEATEETTQAE